MSDTTHMYYKILFIVENMNNIIAIYYIVEFRNYALLLLRHVMSLLCINTSVCNSRCELPAADLDVHRGHSQNSPKFLFGESKMSFAITGVLHKV